MHVPEASGYEYIW